MKKLSDNMRPVVDPVIYADDRLPINFGAEKDFYVDGKRVTMFQSAISNAIYLDETVQWELAEANGVQYLVALKKS